MNKLPIQAAKDVMEKYNLEQVILIARESNGEDARDTVHVVTYGKTKQDCDMAAVDGEKLRRVIEGSPTSLKDAVKLAETVKELCK